MIYTELVLVALVTIYIVDLSGFTESWRAMVAKALKVARLKPMPPFDCSQCMTWWVCLAYAICTGNISLWTIAFSALLAFLSVPIGQMLMLLREWIVALENRLMP